MNADTRISARELSKHFPRHRRRKKGGLSIDGWSALRYLLGQTLRSQSGECARVRASDTVRALDGISFDVRQNEVLGIIGRNGAGKTTLLKVLARIYAPTRGIVRIRGRVVSMLELGIGFAPDLTVRENLQIHGRLAGVPAAQVAAEEDNILRFAGLQMYRDRPLGVCPSGSAVHLAFASMVSLDADVILADEILAVGDSRFRHACEQRVKAVAEKGASVLFVSHDMNAIRRICTRVMWIDRGRVIMCGNTDEVVNAYTRELLSGHMLEDESRSGAACRLLDLRLLDAQQEQIGALQISEPGYIECIIQAGGEKEVTLHIELWNGKHLVFEARPEIPISAGDPGTFRGRMRIPADFLNEAQYRAICRLYARGLSELAYEPVLIHTEKLDFSVMNPHPEESVWADWEWSRAGLVSPKLQWRMELCANSPASRRASRT